MSRLLRLADDLALPIDAVTQKLAFLGRTGSGKTYGASKLAEEMLGAGAQVVILDAVGVWYGLRLAADGKGKGIEIPVFGGLHGDVPLEPTGGQLMANLIVDRGASVIIDVSQFETDAAKARFAAEWADRFFFRKKASPSAVHVFIEECQEFVPQNPQKGEERMLHAFQRIEKLGRNFGIGVSLISQRPQEVNKKALNQTECLFVFQMTGAHERKAIEAWIAGKGLDEDVAGMLPRLQVGQPHVWSPQWLQVSKTVHIAKKRTFNASSTPTVGGRAAAHQLAPIDLARIREDMAATIERAKADDPRELRRTIADLQRQLMKTAPAAKPAAPAKPAPSPVKAEHVKRIERAAAAVTRALAHVNGQVQAQAEVLAKMERSIGETLASVLASVRSAAPAPPSGRGIEALIPTRTPEREGRAAEQPSAPAVPRPRAAARPVSAGDVSLGRGERQVLAAVAQHPDGVTREQLSILTGYKRSSRDTYLQRLGAAGLLGATAGGIIVATDAGVEALGDDFEPLPVGDALRQHWMQRLPRGERAVLEAAVHAFPDWLDRDSIDGYKRSARDTYIQRLGARRLITTDRGRIRVAQELFS